MARDDFTARFTDMAEKGSPLSTSAYARRRFESLVVPFAMPLLIGPGAISTVILFASEAKPFGLSGLAVGFAVILLVCITILVAFGAASLISRLLGRIGLTIVVRVLGLILCAMAVQFIITGVGATTHGLVRPDAVKPYESS
jgi:multiple antibiotic resistance protein